MIELYRTEIDEKETWVTLCVSPDVLAWIGKIDPQLAKDSMKLALKYYVDVPEDVYLMAKLRFQDA